LVTSGAFFVRATLFPEASYDVSKFTTLMGMCTAPMSITSSKYKSWKEVPADLCCDNSNGSCCSDGSTDTVIQFPYSNSSLRPVIPTINPHLLFHCGNDPAPYTNPLVAAISIPTESATTVIEICNILNSLYSWLQFSFTPGGGYDDLNSITVTYPICFKNTICPNSNVFISIENFTLIKD
jgi:hypothetical protein